MESRAERLSTWWDQLSNYERHLARMFARTVEELPPELFRRLAEADVLAVPDELLADVLAGGRSFPMPADIRAFVLGEEA